MAIYVADLRSTSGWTERFNATAAATAVSGDAFRVTHSSTAIYGIAWDTIDADSDRDDVEVLAKVRNAAIPGSSTYGAGVFVRGSAGVNCYAACLRLRTGATVSGSCMTLNVESDSTGVPIDLSLDVSNIPVNTWVWIKLRANGTDIKSKSWLDGNAEPATWGYEGTDATHSAAGWVGIWSYHADGDPYDIGYFAVATNGDSLSTGASGGFFLGADF